MLFAAYAFTVGVFTFDTAMIDAHDRAERWPFFLAGCANVTVAAATFFWPGPTLAGLILAVGIHAGSYYRRWRSARRGCSAVSSSRTRLYGFGGVVTLLRRSPAACAPPARRRWSSPQCCMGTYGLFFGGVLGVAGLRLRRQIAG